MQFNCWENSLFVACISVTMKYKFLVIYMHTHSEPKSRPAFPSTQQVEYSLIPQAILCPLAPESLRHIDLRLKWQMCEWFQNYTQWHGLEAASLGTCSHVAVKDVPHVSVKVFLGPKAVYFFSVMFATLGNFQACSLAQNLPHSFTLEYCQLTEPSCLFTAYLNPYKTFFLPRGRKIPALYGF